MEMENGYNRYCSTCKLMICYLGNTILGREKYSEKQNKPLSESEKRNKARTMENDIRKIISSQDETGRWVASGAIETKVFIRNVNTLCEYINMVKSIQIIKTGHKVLYPYGFI